MGRLNRLCEKNVVFYNYDGNPKLNLDLHKTCSTPNKIQRA